MLQYLFSYASSGEYNAAFSYIVQRLTYILGLILELGGDFLIAAFKEYDMRRFFFYLNQDDT